MYDQIELGPAFGLDLVLVDEEVEQISVWCNDAKKASFANRHNIASLWMSSIQSIPASPAGASKNGISKGLPPSQQPRTITIRMTSPYDIFILPLSSITFLCMLSRK